MNKYRILSLDGGGIRGLLTSIIIERIETALPGWRDDIELYAGTSTGGIIALGLANGYAPTKVRDLYYGRSEIIFQDSWFDNILDLGNAIGAKYDTNNLRAELFRLFGNLTLGDLNTRVLVPAFHLDNGKPAPDRMWSPKFFHNFENGDSDSDQRIVDVALYTSAAPSYFPPVDGYIDGGVVANNPSMAALAQAQDHRCQERCPTLGAVRLLSLGSGHIHRFIAQENKALDWGWGQWARPILNIMGEGLGDIAHYQCEQILGANRYHRLDPHLQTAIELDDWSKRDQLVALAEAADLTPTLAWLEKHWL